MQDIQITMVQTSLLFPLLAIAATVTAYLAPGVFIPLKASIVPLLTIIMFGMRLAQPLGCGAGQLVGDKPPFPVGVTELRQRSDPEA